MASTSKIRVSFNEIGRLRRSLCVLVAFFKPTHIKCTWHLQAIYLSLPNYQQFAKETGLKFFKAERLLTIAKNLGLLECYFLLADFFVVKSTMQPISMHYRCLYKEPKQYLGKLNTFLT